MAQVNAACLLFFAPISKIANHRQTGMRERSIEIIN
jgi:hypothetical protein